ncbi:hypothetical protein MMC17_004140 [Xylographa soralifera]|nr:hypothetical protein [Xylographa soralifera]
MLILETRPDDRPDPPEMWRNSLVQPSDLDVLQVTNSSQTALSQYHNLYFVAIGANLYVYKPHFPSQRLHSRPHLVIPLPSTGLSDSGDINADNPHAVNHLKVGDLGNEELIVCTCDDGDVIALTTRSLAYELEQIEARRPDFVSKLRPFFHCSVGLSAWGIAIHKEARLIAISANTHQITVFAFALRQERSPDSQGVPQDSEAAEEIENEIYQHEDGWQSAGPAGLNPDRSRDQILILGGHTANIPSISFCNTEDDPAGRYLISMDIVGTVAVWRIFEGNHQYYTSQQIAEEHGIPIPRNAVWHGWNLLCLDPRSFRPLKKEVEIFGCKALVNYGDRSWDISRSQREVTDSSRWHPSSNVPTPAGLLPLHLEVADDTRAEEEDEDSEEEDLDDDYSSDEVVDDEMNIELLRENLRPSDPPSSNTAPTSTSTTTTATAPPLPFLLLICSTTTPTLWSPNSLSSAHPIPATHLTHMLDQHIPASHAWLRQFDRLSMSLQIPFLGIVILASQAGRVALLTLTRHGRTPSCAFRLDWVLPFASQEQRGERPAAPLLGVAVGPVQGSGPQPKRWRLMLTYYDYSVLSYEIGRGEGFEAEVLVF